MFSRGTNAVRFEFIRDTRSVPSLNTARFESNGTGTKTLYSEIGIQGAARGKLNQVEARKESFLFLLRKIGSVPVAR